MPEMAAAYGGVIISISLGPEAFWVLMAFRVVGNSPGRNMLENGFAED